MLSALLVYTLKSALVLTLLYVPYTLMLRHERFFRLNRLTLLTVLLAALVLPLCHVKVPDTLTQMPVIADTQEVIWHTEAVIVGAEAPLPHGIDWRRIACLAYVMGVLTVLCLRVCQLVQIHRAMRRGCLWRQREEDGVTVYCHVGDGAPFSWMRSIYICETDYEQNGRAILLHERAHIHCCHSLDILLLTLVEVVQWWNPFVYRLGQSLRDVHEYEADDHVLRQGVSLADYRMLLVRKAVADTSFAFANNFNRSHVAKRIAMMKRPPSSLWMRGKVLYMVPLLLFTLVLSAAPVIEPLLFLNGEEVGAERVLQLPKESIDHITVLKGVSAKAVYGERARGGAVIFETKAPPVADDHAVFLIAEEMPEFPGGEAAMRQYLSQHMRYPSDVQRARLQGRIDVTFIVETDGSLSDIHAAFTGDTAEGTEVVVTGYRREGAAAPPTAARDRLRSSWVASAEQLVSQMPRWIPARQQGRTVRARVTLPLYYRLQ